MERLPNGLEVSSSFKPLPSMDKMGTVSEPGEFGS